MDEYSGALILIRADGTEHRGVGSYRGPGWRGSFSGGTDALSLEGEITVRLPDGREGRALVTNVVIDSARDRVRVEFAGNGPAPA